MIKVQPARSRIVRTETSEKILLVMPSKGIASAWTCLFILSASWFGGAVWAIAGVVRSDPSPEILVFLGAFSLPGLVGILISLSMSLKSWSFQRDSSWVTFRMGGLLGTRERRWPVQEVASFYPQSSGTTVGLEEVPEAWLGIGFRNGRSDFLVKGEYEEIAWVSAMLMDPRGTRKVAATLQIAAEPERRKLDPAIVPPTLTCRTEEGGVDVVFRPLLRSRGLWWKLPLAALLGIVSVTVASWLLYRSTKGGFPLAVPRLTIAAIVCFSGWRIWVLLKSAVIQVADGMVYVVQNPGQKRLQFGKVDVEFIQTFRASGRTELQFLLKGQPKVRLLDGRPAEELEWAARFLRVAIKGAHAPEAATMQVDAAAGECQVCLEKMDSRVVYCAKCRTPHHEECWTYMGMCSTYGCREIRFERQ